MTRTVLGRHTGRDWTVSYPRTSPKDGPQTSPPWVSGYPVRPDLGQTFIPETPCVHDVYFLGVPLSVGPTGVPGSF